MTEEVSRLLEEATAIFRGMDLNQDNQVNLQEWMAAFDSMDPHKTRTITRKEWCRKHGGTEMFDGIFKQYSVRLTRMEWKQGFDSVDVDNNNSISLNEWSHKAMERAFTSRIVPASVKAEEDTGVWLQRRQKEKAKRQNSGELMRKRMQPTHGLTGSPGASPLNSPRASLASPRAGATASSPRQTLAPLAAPSRTVCEASPLCSSSSDGSDDGLVWSRPKQYSASPSGGDGGAPASPRGGAPLSLRGGSPASPRGIGKLDLAAVQRVKSNGLEMRPKAEEQREAAAKHREAVLEYEAEIAGLKRELSEARAQAAGASGLREELAQVKAELQRRDKQLVQLATKFAEGNAPSSRAEAWRDEEGAVGTQVAAQPRVPVQETKVAAQPRVPVQETKVLAEITRPTNCRLPSSPSLPSCDENISAGCDDNRSAYLEAAAQPRPEVFVKFDTDTF